MTAPLCTCGHERTEHETMDDRIILEVCCCRCECEEYAPRQDAHHTVSFTDLPVSQGARDLFAKVIAFDPLREPYQTESRRAQILDILAAADERDVRSLLWARRVGKL